MAVVGDELEIILNIHVEAITELHVRLTVRDEFVLQVLEMCLRDQIVLSLNFYS